MYFYNNISLSSSYNEKFFRQSRRENQNTHFTFNNVFPKIAPLWDNVEKCDGAMEATDDDTIEHMRFACLFNKATDTRSEYIILIAFPRLQRLRERA
jgi:hypothetical protein